MFLFCIAMQRNAFIDMHSQVIKPGEIIQRHADMFPGFISVNFAVINSTSRKSLPIYVYQEYRRNFVFPEKTNYQPICCPENSSFCEKGTVYFNENAPVLLQKIKRKNASSSKIVIQQNIDFEIYNKGVWTLLLPNCEDKDIIIEGNAIIKKHDGYMDGRIKKFYTISILVIIVGVSMVLYNVFMWITTFPKLLPEHQQLLFLISLFIANGFSSLRFFNNWILTGQQDMFMLLIDALIRSASVVLTYYFMLKELQKQENNFYLFFLSFIPMFIGAYIENMGIANISSKHTGRWVFGFGIPCIEFVTKLSIHSFVFLYSYFSTSVEASSDNRRMMLRVCCGTLIAFVMMNLTLFVWRFNKNLPQTRGCEWVPYTFHYIFMAIILTANAWYVGGYNPEGWQTLEGKEDKSSLFYVKRPKNSKNVGSKMPMEGREQL